MILDSIKHVHLYYNIAKGFKKAFDFLMKTDFSKLEIGKHELDGEDLMVILMEYETKDADECKMENHKKYIDIQYMVEGEELIGISTFHDQVPTEPYNEVKDVAFYSPEYTSLVKLQKGYFAIFFPQDLHRPCIKTDRRTLVRKAVFKIKVQ
jgi:YhcH/YjgK/YiaL family protein